MKTQQGFTLIELVITIVLTSIIAVISFDMLSQGLTAYLTAKNVTHADQQARLALARMSRDLRSVSSSSAITTATASQITLTNLSGTSISYSLSGTNLLYNTQVLVDGIGSLTFTYYDINGNTTATISAIRYISVSLGVTGNNANFTVSTTMFPPNLA